MNPTQKTSAVALAACVLFASSAALSQKQPAVRSDKATAAQVQQVIKNWKQQPRKVAQDIMRKYGPPHEVAKQRLVWHDTGPWKRTELVNEEIDHKFPMPHKDMLYQVVNFQVPVDKFDDIAAFDGSVIVERTRGELGARCDKEPANFLAVNLAYEIATGQRTVEDARRIYAEQILALASQQPAPLTERLTFQPPQAAAGDPDRQTIEESAAQKAMEQMKKMGAAKQ